MIIESLRGWGGFRHQPLPLEVAEDGDDDIDAIEARLEGDILVEIEPAGDHIDDNPDEPLFQIFACQSPDTDDAQGGGEGVEYGDVAVGEARQQEIDGSPDHSGEAEPYDSVLLGHVPDGQVGAFLLMAHPRDEAVDGHGEVVELHAAVGIEAFLVI